MERRKRDRVNVRLECRIGPAGQAEQGPCNVTENISRTGMLIRWDWATSAAPMVGDRFLAKLKLPASPMFGQRWMLFQSEVVRVSQAADAALLVAVTGSPLRISQIDAPSPSPYPN